MVKNLRLWCLKDLLWLVLFLISLPRHNRSTPRSRSARWCSKAWRRRLVGNSCEGIAIGDSRNPSNNSGLRLSWRLRLKLSLGQLRRRRNRNGRGRWKLRWRQSPGIHQLVREKDIMPWNRWEPELGKFASKWWTFNQDDLFVSRVCVYSAQIPGVSIIMRGCEEYGTAVVVIEIPVDMT